MTLALTYLPTCEQLCSTLYSTTAFHFSPVSRWVGAISSTMYSAFSSTSHKSQEELGPLCCAVRTTFHWYQERLGCCIPQCVPVIENAINFERTSKQRVDMLTSQMFEYCKRPKQFVNSLMWAEFIRILFVHVSPSFKPSFTRDNV